MIQSLRIEQLAVVESVELEFGAGLNVLTGETGAGKSLVLGALALLAGARASSDAVREGAEEAAVEAVLCTEALPELEAELAARGLECEDHELIVRRTVSRNGRSRARIGGALVPISTLAELFAGRIEISSQHESQGLLRPDAQGWLLDAYAGLQELRGELAEAVATLRAWDEEAARLRKETEERARRSDFLAFQVGEIDEASLEVGEGEALRQERQRLVHAERLREDAQVATTLLAGDPAQSDATSVADLLATVVRRAGELAEFDPELANLSERLAGVQAEAADAARELERYGARIEDDPGRLATLDERLGVLEGLRRKYGASEEEVLAHRDRAAAELAALGGADARLEKLEAERAAVVPRVEKLAAKLSAGRKKAAGRLSKQVEAALADLAMAGARFEVALEPLTLAPGIHSSPGGLEAPEFRLSANPGSAPRPLARVASGGELSRVFLALKNVLRRGARGVVLVFDEVDAGVGGRVADRVGKVLAELAQDHQVLCITHLPQIAARAHDHFRVAKAQRAGRTGAGVEALDRKARVEEIARMAGGETVSDATRRHARALLDAKD